MLTHLSLFTGIGGIDIAAEWAGFNTVGQCEWADYPTKVLERHWPEVPRWRDIRTLTKESFNERTGLKTVDIISGGFPCQPFSVAGKREGVNDERFLWPEMLRVIREIRPTWVLGENVVGVISIAGRQICEDLEREGYAISIFDFEAAAVGAPHRRARVFFVGQRYADLTQRSDQKSTLMGDAEYDGYAASTVARKTDGDARADKKREESAVELAGTSRSGDTGDVAHTSGERRKARWHVHGVTEEVQGKREFSTTDRTQYKQEWRTKPRLGGVSDGLSGRLDGHRWPAMLGQEQYDWEPPRVSVGTKDRANRLKCLGNAVVPQQVYPILQAIATVSGEHTTTVEEQS